jgi:hypothetical protein
MTIHAFVFLSTHARFLASPWSAGQLTHFLQFVNANVAKEAVMTPPRLLVAKKKPLALPHRQEETSGTAPPRALPRREAPASPAPRDLTAPAY